MKLYELNLTVLMVVFLVMLTLPSVYSEQQSLPNQKLGDCVELTQSHPNATSINITKIKYPSGSGIETNYSVIVMLTSNNLNYYYDFCNNNYLGEYIITTCGNGDGIKTCMDYNFLTTRLGTYFDNSKAMSYIIILIISILVFLGLLLMGIALPIGNKKDEITGYILYVSNLKYFKLLCLGFAYICLVFISYFSWALSYSYLDLEFVSNIFWFFFIALVVCILPLFILFTYLTITNLVRDSQIGDLLSRGLKVN